MVSDPGIGTPRHADDATPSEERAATTSLGDLMGEVSRDISTLMRQELDLAKAELRQSATRAGKGAGMFVAQESRVSSPCSSSRSRCGGRSATSSAMRGPA